MPNQFSVNKRNQALRNLGLGHEVDREAELREARREKVRKREKALQAKYGQTKIKLPHVKGKVYRAERKMDVNALAQSMFQRVKNALTSLELSNGSTLSPQRSEFTRLPGEARLYHPVAKGRGRKDSDSRLDREAFLERRYAVNAKTKRERDRKLAHVEQEAQRARTVRRLEREAKQAKKDRMIIRPMPRAIKLKVGNESPKDTSQGVKLNIKFKPKSKEDKQP